MNVRKLHTEPWSFKRNAHPNSFVLYCCPTETQSWDDLVLPWPLVPACTAVIGFCELRLAGINPESSHVTSQAGSCVWDRNQFELFVCWWIPLLFISCSCTSNTIRRVFPTASHSPPVDRWQQHVTMLQYANRRDEGKNLLLNHVRQRLTNFLSLRCTFVFPLRTVLLCCILKSCCV